MHRSPASEFHTLLPCPVHLTFCLFSTNWQAVLKTFSGSAAPQHSDTIVIDEVELQRHQQLERLYASTKAGKVRHGEEEAVLLTGADSCHVARLTALSKRGCARAGGDGGGRDQAARTM